MPFLTASQLNIFQCLKSMPPIIWPGTYGRLNRALDAKGQLRDKMINDFLKEYYQGMRNAYWYGTDKLDDGGYFGYWCFELAAFVRLLDISDDAFANNPYYPGNIA